MLSNKEINVLYEKLDAIGLDQVRSNLANGVYGRNKKAHVEEWVKLKEIKDSSVTKEKVIETLNYIKTNKGCKSNNLNIDIVSDLYQSGYIEGIDASSFEGNAFIELRLNLEGEEYLSNLFRAEEAPSKTKIENKHKWYQKPIGILGIGIATVVLSAMVVKLLGL